MKLSVTPLEDKSAITVRSDVEGGTILMIAFHYPPFAASSGYLRTTFFSRYLRDSGWVPTVLTVQPRVYGQKNERMLDIAGSVNVIRCRALDTTRDLSWHGKYPLILALPDRWVSWLVPAVFAGIRAIRRNQVRVIWSTFPIPTAVLIGLVLKKLTKRPWVVDIRDVILDDDFPVHPRERAAYAWLERKVARNADAVVVTTNGAKAMYAERYPALKNRLHCIPNGFEESVFENIKMDSSQLAARRKHRLTLLHSGLLSRVDRNPIPFFNAMQNLVHAGESPLDDVRILLRASGDQEFYENELRSRELLEIIRLKSAINYEDALREMCESSGLILFQGSTCNHAVPAKLYEYLRCGRPILAVTDPAGDVAQLLRTLQIGVIADCNDASDIEAKLTDFISLIRSNLFQPLDTATLESFSRESQTSQLADLLRHVSQTAVAKYTSS